MKKSKELGKKNEGKEYKKVMTNDKAAKIITNEIDSRTKLNGADKYLQKNIEIDLHRPEKQTKKTKPCPHPLKYIEMMKP
jgi:hypothetical protein